MNPMLYVKNLHDVQNRLAKLAPVIDPDVKQTEDIKRRLLKLTELINKARLEADVLIEKIERLRD